MKIIFWGDSITEGKTGSSYVDMLRNHLPEHVLINCGKSGDTVITLYQRLITTSIDKSVDIAVLWIGVNDIFIRASWMFQILKKLSNHPWSKNIDQFEEYYINIIDRLTNHSKKVFSVSPLFLSENCNNKWNRELEEISRCIERVSNSHKNVHHINLRDIFRKKLSSSTASHYFPKSPISIHLNAWAQKDPETMKRKASERGLQFTIDGVHLNKAGAEIVADVLMERFTSKLHI